MDLVTLASLTYAALRALPHYRSRFEGTRCACCKGDVKLGELVIQLAPKGSESRPWIQLFRDLGLMDTKRFKYVHASCVPPELREASVAVVRAAVDQLWSLTDPNWPLDFRGFNKADAGPAQRWIKSGYHPILAYPMACRLIKYIDTQLGPEVGEVIRAVVAEGDKATSVVQTNLPVQAPTFTPKPAAPPRNPVVVDARGDVVVITLDAPWNNPAHAGVKDRIKARGARFDGASKTWTMRASVFAAYLPTLLGDEPARITEAAEQTLLAASARSVVP